jgi:hypothetical protein
MRRRWRPLGVFAILALLILITVEPAGRGNEGTVLALPSFKGLNYGVPLTSSADWVGTAWLQANRWPQVRPAMAADLTFIEQRHLGRVVRLFIAIDQLMNWNSVTGFAGFKDRELSNLSQALDLFDAHGIKVIAVLFDQEVRGSPGNFRFQALDGHHDAMRGGYLQATGEFLSWLGERSTIAAIDLFNEAYSSLGTDGRLPKPPAADPVSPGYSGATVHQFLRDLYTAAKRANDHIPLTVSDATLYWQPQPDLSRYDDILDFYDVHVYDDHPNLQNVRRALDKPYIVGEAGAAIVGGHFSDQAVEPGVIQSLLEEGRANGAEAVLVHSIANQNVFPASHDRLTPTGEVLAKFDASGTSLREPSIWPIVEGKARLVLFVTTAAALSARSTGSSSSSKYATKEETWVRPLLQPWPGGP